MARIYTILSLFFLCCFFGCGGGSTGTDGGISIRVMGTVQTPDGNPVPDVTVTIKENGDTATTDSAGQYTIDTTVMPGTVELLVEKDNKETQTSFDASQARAQDTVAVAITLDEAVFAVSIASVTIVAEPGPTPEPTVDIPRTYSLEGRIRTANGSSVAGFVVRVSGSSASDKSDQRGQFSLSTSDRTPELIISNKKHSVSVDLGTIPASARRVRIELVVTIIGSGGISTQADKAQFKVKAKVRY